MNFSSLLSISTAVLGSHTAPESRHPLPAISHQSSGHMSSEAWAVVEKAPCGISASVELEVVLRDGSVALV